LKGGARAVGELTGSQNPVHIQHIADSLRKETYVENAENTNKEAKVIETSTAQLKIGLGKVLVEHRDWFKVNQ